MIEIILIVILLVLFFMFREKTRKSFLLVVACFEQLDEMNKIVKKNLTDEIYDVRVLMGYEWDLKERKWVKVKSSKRKAKR